MPFRNAMIVAFCLAASATAASGQEVIKVTAQARAACLPDAMRYCRDAVPNVQNVLICFGQHREQISSRCRTVLASYGLQ